MRKHGWQATFDKLMREHNKYSASGKKVVSYETIAKRRNILYCELKALREMGYKFTTVYAIGNRHIQALMDKWVADGLSARTIKNKLSVFRVFAQWIGKPGMVREAEYYVNDPEIVRIDNCPDQPKTWSDHGFDPLEKIAEVRKTEPRIADSLLLQHLFGLRGKESLLIRPHVADKGSYLHIEHGPKGGRERQVEITTKQQREALDRIKKTVKINESMTPKNKTYIQHNNHYYYVLRQHGICRENGLTAHGLRHGHVNDYYEQVTGHNDVVKYL